MIITLSSIRKKKVKYENDRWNWSEVAFWLSVCLFVVVTIESNQNNNNNKQKRNNEENVINLLHHHYHLEILNTNFPKKNIIWNKVLLMMMMMNDIYILQFLQFQSWSSFSSDIQQQQQQHFWSSIGNVENDNRTLKLASHTHTYKV